MPGRRTRIAAALTTAALAAAAALVAAHPTTSHAAPSAHGKSLAGKVIQIDPGHNLTNWRYPAEINRPVFYGVPGRTKPCDTTGTATASGYTEARFNLAVGLHVVKYLRDMGATVVMTPVDTRPWGPCITRRAAIGNRIHADAAVSIHADGAPSWVHGFYVIVPRYPLPGVGLGPRRIAHDVRLGAAMIRAYRAITRLHISNLYTSGYLRSDDYAGTNLSHVPKIFIETGNMRNPRNAARLESRSFRHRIAWGIARGIRLYLTGHIY